LKSDVPALYKKSTFENYRGFLNKEETINILISEDLKEILETVERHLSGDYPLFLLLARTGLRIGEALALKWDDIDFNDRSIEVCRNFYRNRITKPKNGKTRLVDMSLQLTKILKAHELSCKKKGLALGMGDLPEYVFTNKYGRLINLYEWQKQIFYKAIKKAGIKKIGIHGLRHTYATLRISKGDNVADVSKQLGHHSVKFTMDTYYHWFPGKKKSEVDGLDDLIHPNAPYMHPITANHT
jgi:integrase